MPKQKIDKDFLLKESFRIFRRKSYHNTTMSDIADACGLLKGSIYHYFKSKESLMKEVMERMHVFFSEEVFSIAYKENCSGLERLMNIYAKTHESFVNRNGGNLMGNIGIETARIIPEFAGMIQQFFTDWKTALKHIFLEDLDENTAEDFAEQNVAEIEGAVMMMRIYDDPSYLTRAIERLTIRYKYLINR